MVFFHVDILKHIPVPKKIKRIELKVPSDLNR